MQNGSWVKIFLLHMLSLRSSINKKASSKSFSDINYQTSKIK